ncbi:hypothetical protein Stok01_02184 [Sulfurisphaera tokodaii]
MLFRLTKFLSFLVNNTRKLGILNGNYIYEVKDFYSTEPKGEAYKIDEIEFDIPVMPSAIICTLVNTPGMIGVKDKSEAREFIKSPKFFLKLPSVAIPHKKPIITPKDAIRPEVEIGVITRKIKRGATLNEIKKNIIGYTVFNDITYPPGIKEDSYYAYRRDPSDGKVKKLLIRGTHFRNKVRDSFAPFGPWIVTPEEIDDVNSLEMKSYYDGKLVQEGNSEDFVFSIEEIILELTKYVTLPEFSLISSGSVGYIGAEEVSEFSLKPINNAIMVAEVEKIGKLENPTIIDENNV